MSYAPIQGKQKLCYSFTIHTSLVIVNRLYTGKIIYKYVFCHLFFFIRLQCIQIIISVLTKERNFNGYGYGLNSARKVKLIMFYIVFLTNTTFVVIIVKDGN